MPVPPPSRRTVLRGLAGIPLGLTVLALTGCSGDDDGPGSPGAEGEPDPDLALLARALADKQDLLSAYEATLARHRQLAPRLEPMRADHSAHLAALTDLRPGVSAAPSASASPTGTAAPSDREAAVEALATAELAAAGRRIGQCREARDPQLARLLASVGGSEAAHTAVLRAGGS